MFIYNREDAKSSVAEESEQADLEMNTLSVSLSDCADPSLTVVQMTITRSVWIKGELRLLSKKGQLQIICLQPISNFLKSGLLLGGRRKSDTYIFGSIL